MGSKLEEKVTTPVKNRLTNYFMVATKPKPDTNSKTMTNQEITNVVESNDANTNRKRERDDNQQNDAEMKVVDEADKATVNGQGKEEKTKLKEPKKKKRRVVMCELID